MIKQIEVMLHTVKKITPVFGIFFLSGFLKGNDVVTVNRYESTAVIDVYTDSVFYINGLFIRELQDTSSVSFLQRAGFPNLEPLLTELHDSTYFYQSFQNTIFVESRKLRYFNYPSFQSSLDSMLHLSLTMPDTLLYFNSKLEKRYKKSREFRGMNLNKIHDEYIVFKGEFKCKKNGKTNLFRIPNYELEGNSKVIYKLVQADLVEIIEIVAIEKVNTASLNNIIRYNDFKRAKGSETL